MTIKQNGGIFGRNPEYNTLNVVGKFDAGGDATFNADIIAGKLKWDAANEALSYNTGSPQGPIHLNAAQSDISMFLTGSGDGWAITNNYIANNNTDLVFGRINGGGGVNERIRFSNAGNITLLSGQGIDFSATSGTGTSELFDDYEEGNFTATLNATSGSFTLNAALNSMSYTKIGRMVFITGMVGISSSTATGTFFELESLPFPVADLGETSGRSAGMASLDSIGAVGLIGKISETNTKIRFTIDASTVTGNIYFNLNYVAA